MAQPTTTSNNSTSRGEDIKVYHLITADGNVVKALKSDGEQNTISQTCAKSLGHHENSSFDLQWRLKTCAKMWTDSFDVVKNPTTVGGITYNVVLSAQASEKLLRAQSGSYVALAKGSKSKSKEEKEKQRQEEKDARRRVESELEEERRKREERYQNKAVAAVS